MQPFNPYAMDEAEVANKMKMAQALQGRRGIFWNIKGRRDSDQAMELARALQERKQSDFSSDMGSISQAMQGRTAKPAEVAGYGGAGDVAETPAVSAATPQQLIAEALAQLKSPAGQQFALGQIQQQLKPEAPYTLKPGEIRYGPGGQVISRGATERPAAPAPEAFTLPPGAKRIGPDGNLIADNPRPEQAPQKAPPGYRFTPNSDLEAIPGGPADLKLQGALNQDTATLGTTESALDRLSVAANEVMRHPGLKGITGVRGAIPDIPGTNAANARAKLQTLKAQIGFNVLQEIRNASKTGGALGSVTEKELGFLQNALAAVDTAQDDVQMSESLQKLMDYAAGAKVRLRQAYNLKHGGKNQAQTGGWSIRPAK